MQKTIITFLLAVSSFTAMAQQADQRIGELLNSSDWFALNREYPTLKDSVQEGYLRQMGEVMLAWSFNRPTEAIASIDTLFAKYQDDLSLYNAFSMTILKAKSLARLGRYADAADLLHKFSSEMTGENFPMLHLAVYEAYKFYNKLRDCKPTTLLRPSRDVSVKANIEAVKLNVKNDTVKDRGNHLRMKVTANGKPCMAVFDTGAQMSFCSMSFVRDAGVRILVDSVAGEGATKYVGGIGVIDSLAVGDMKFNDVLVAFTYEDAVVDSVLQLGFVLGMNVIDKCGEVQFYPKQGVVVFPYNLSPLPKQGRNLTFDDEQLTLMATSEGQTYKFLFDTGNTKTTLSPNFYAKNKVKVDSLGVKVMRLSGGVGDFRAKDFLSVPSLTLNVGGQDVTLDNVLVSWEKGNFNVPFDGNVGLELIERCRKATLNVRDMFLKIE